MKNLSHETKWLFSIIAVGLMIWGMGWIFGKSNEMHPYRMSRGEVFYYLNIENPALSRSDQLDRIAQKRADEMTVFSHDKFFASHLLASTTDPAYSFEGEDLAIGYSNGSATMDAWLNSPIHKAVIDNKIYEAVGLGIRYIDPAHPMLDEHGNENSGWLVVAEFGGVSK